MDTTWLSFALRKWIRSKQLAHHPLRGGGWCNSVKSCVFRKTTRRGSPNFMEKELPIIGILSSNAEQNPGSSFWMLSWWPSCYYTLDEFHGLFPSTTRVKCLSDAGLFLVVADVSGGPTLRDLYGGVVRLQGVQKNLPCICTNHLDPTSVEMLVE